MLSRCRLLILDFLLAKHWAIFASWSAFLPTALLRLRYEQTYVIHRFRLHGMLDLLAVWLSESGVRLVESMGMHCRSGCGACCIAPSISSAIPGMPHGKLAGERCVQLNEHNQCRIFGQPDRPAVCSSLQPQPEMCGASREHAMQYLTSLERMTA